REREVAAAAEREPVDRGDGRLPHRLQEPRARVPEAAPLPRLEDGQVAHVLDVRASDERALAGAGQHDDPRLLVARQLAQPVVQRAQRLAVERVHRLRTLDCEDRDPVLAGEADAQTGTLAFRNSTISLVDTPGVNTSATPRS